VRLLLSCLLVGFVLSGCSTADDEPPAPDATVDEASLAEGLAGMYAGDNPQPDDVTEGDCFADGLLAATTPEQLREGGLVDASYAVVTEIPALDAALAGTVADAQLACTDFIEDSTAAQGSITRGRLDADAYAACLGDELDDAAIRASVVASLMGEWEDPALVRLSEAQATCADG